MSGPPPTAAYAHPVPPMGSMGFPPGAHGGGDMNPMASYMSPPGRFDPGPAFEHGGAAYPVMPDSGEQRVLMVYGIPPNMNCQHLFNIFCQYGNVLKVRRA